MSKIKKFFSKKKEEAAFKLKLGGVMGQGHALNAPQPESSSSQRRSDPNAYVPPTRTELSQEARAAASAAINRIQKKDHKEFNTSLAAIKAQAKRELESERKQKDDINQSAEIKPNANSTPGVFFRCPLVSDEILPKNEWKAKIKEFLYQQMESEKALTACLIIHNCNPKEKAEECIETLAKYLENIINHPNEEKYCKIRMSNRIFCEKVRYVLGAMEFLEGAGFSQVELDNEPFLIWSAESVEQDYDLPTLLEALKNAEPMKLELDRNIKVLLPSQVNKVQLPDDFYRISPEEVKREQQLRAEAVENSQMLKTKAMRDREEQRNLRIYKYSLIRIKFPNGLSIQGTFNVYEKLNDVFDFVQSCLQEKSMEFKLVQSSERSFTENDMQKTLHDLRLIPNTVLLFDSRENSNPEANFIKEELLLMVQSV